MPRLALRLALAASLMIGAAALLTYGAADAGTAEHGRLETTAAAEAGPTELPAAKAHAPRVRHFVAVSPSVYYATCAAARAVGVAPLLRGDPGYDIHLDQDGDGVACEQ